MWSSLQEEQAGEMLGAMLKDQVGMSGVTDLLISNGGSQCTSTGYTQIVLKKSELAEVPAPGSSPGDTEPLPLTIPYPSKIDLCQEEQNNPIPYSAQALWEIIS